MSKRQNPPAQLFGLGMVFLVLGMIEAFLLLSDSSPISRTDLIIAVADAVTFSLAAVFLLIGYAISTLAQ